MMQPIRQIGKPDVEFYYAAHVMKVAYAISGLCGDQFSELSYRKRQNYLDKAVTAVQTIVNNGGIK